MDKKEILEQLENIQSLMSCDIFYFDLEDCVGGYDNEEMYKGISKAIEIIKNK